MTVEFAMSHSTERPPAEFIDLIKTTERAGFDSVWITDSGLQGRDCYPYLTLCALNSHKLIIGTGVTNLLSRHVGITSNAINSIDELSNGRAILGISAGGPWNLAELGLRAPVPSGFFLEKALQIKKLLEGETVTFSGAKGPAKLSFGRIRRVPLYVAATGPKMLEISGEIADGVIVSTGVNSKCIEFAKKKIEEGAKKSKRDPQKIKLVNWTFCGLAKDRKAAVDSVRPLAMWSPALYPFLAEIADSSTKDLKLIKEASLNKHDFVKMTQITKMLSEEFILKFGIAGTTDQCIEQLKDLSKTGVHQIAILTGEHGVGQEVKGVVEQFGREIIPAFK